MQTATQKSLDDYVDEARYYLGPLAKTIDLDENLRRAKETQTGYATTVVIYSLAGFEIPGQPMSCPQMPGMCDCCTTGRFQRPADNS